VTAPQADELIDVEVRRAGRRFYWGQRVVDGAHQNL
jgi:hypothetical protein